MSHRLTSERYAEIQDYWYNFHSVASLETTGTEMAMELLGHIDAIERELLQAKVFESDREVAAYVDRDKYKTENARLREELRFGNHLHAKATDHINDLEADSARLREALEQIADANDFGVELQRIAREALERK